MAQIRVQEKRSGLGWLWALIALALLAALAWYFMSGRRGGEAGGDVAPGTAPADSVRRDTVIRPRGSLTMPVSSPWSAHERRHHAPPIVHIV